MRIRRRRAAVALYDRVPPASKSLGLVSRRRLPRCGLGGPSDRAALTSAPCLSFDRPCESPGSYLIDCATPLRCRRDEQGSAMFEQSCLGLVSASVWRDACRQAVRIAIVGGGLAGLAAANALKPLRDEGGGLRGRSGSGRDRRRRQRQPAGASRRCKRSVLATRSPLSRTYRPESTRATCKPVEFLEFNDRHKAAARYGAPYYTFHRADLLDALASGLDHRAIHLGHRLTGLEERQRPRRARFRRTALKSRPRS